MANIKKLGGVWQRATVATSFDLDASVIHDPTPSWMELRSRHHSAAGHYGSPLMTAARLDYAYAVALPAEAMLLTARWIVHSPARIAVAAVLVFLVVLWM